MDSFEKPTASLDERIDVMAAGGVVGGKSREYDMVGPEGQEEPKPKDNVLTGPSFLSRTTLPDVQPNTKILAVCGINDWFVETHDPAEGMANPLNDGWIFSDFLLFHHLFGIEALNPKDQEWLLCVKPKTLVEKYGEFYHGSDKVDQPRRVVLDESKLNSLQNVHYCDPNQLLEIFLKRLTAAVVQAEKEDQHLLVLVFSHGYGATKDYSVLMGGENPADPACPHLEIEAFKSAVVEGLGGKTESLKRGLCMLTSACHSGGWAINPNLNVINILAASSHADETVSWPFSGSLNSRLCSSPWAISNVLVSMNVENCTADDHKSFVKSPTYAGVMSILQTELRRIFDVKNRWGVWGQDPTFTSVNDEWEMQWSERTGIPLANFRARWGLLKDAPRGPPPPPSPEPESPPAYFASAKKPGKTGPPASGASGGKPGASGPSSYPKHHRYHPDNLVVYQLEEEEGGRWFSYNQILKLTKRDAQTYLDSYPGADNAAKNTFIAGRIRKLRRNERPIIGSLLGIWHSLDYRLNVVMASATSYKNRLGLKELPDCHKVDTIDFGNRGHHDYRKIYELVCSHRLFDLPGKHEGVRYEKGDKYLTACLTLSNWGWQSMVMKMNELTAYRNLAGEDRGAVVVPNTTRATHTINSTGIKRLASIRSSFQDWTTATGKRLRSLSPVKKRGVIVRTGTDDST